MDNSKNEEFEMLLRKTRNGELNIKDFLNEAQKIKNQVCLYHVMLVDKADFEDGKLKQGAKMTPCYFHDNYGDYYFPIFTSEKIVHEQIKESCIIFPTTFDNIIDLNKEKDIFAFNIGTDMEAKVGFFSLAKMCGREIAPSKIGDFCLTLISARGKAFDFESCVKKYFAKKLKSVETTNQGDLLVTFLDGTTMEVHLLEKDKIRAQIEGMVNFYNKIKLDNQALKISILRQIAFCNSIAYFKFEATDMRERTKAIVESIFKIAKASSSVVIHNNLDLYTTDNKLLLSKDGRSELTEYYPIASSDFVIKKKPILNDNDKKRIEKNITALKKNDIPCLENMLNLPFDCNTKLLDKEDIWNVLIKNYVLASVAATLNDSKNEKLYEEIYEKFNMLYDIDKILDGDSKKLLEELKNGECQVTSKLTWRYEIVAMLMWSLSLMDFPEQDRECDVDAMNSMLYFIENGKEVKDKIKLRDKEKILEKADLLHRYLWALEEDRIKKLDLHLNLDEAVIRYQVQGLDLALGYNEN